MKITPKRILRQMLLLVQFYRQFRKHDGVLKAVRLSFHYAWILTR